jgi:hypothetical protein
MPKLKNMNLLELKELANKEHQLAWREFLEHARQCGLALREIKHRHKHGKWKKMFDGRTFDFSYPTASVYMRVAKHWNDPDIVEAREKGQVDSIQSFLNALQDNRESKHPARALTKQELQEYDKACRYLATEFKKCIARMSPDEVQVLYERFDHFWFDWYAQVQAACKSSQPKVKACA